MRHVWCSRILGAGRLYRQLGEKDGYRICQLGQGYIRLIMSLSEKVGLRQEEGGKQRSSMSVDSITR